MSEDRIAQLRRIGAGLYGRQWQTPLSEDLGINPRTLRRWLSGDWSIPADAWEQLRDLMLDRRYLLANLVNELRREEVR